MMQILLNDEYLMEIHRKFGGAVFRRSSVFHELRRFIEGRRITGNCAVEIGTWNGITAVILSRYFKHVISMDIVHNPIRYEIVEHLGIKNVEFLNIKNNDHKANLLRKMEFDFAYVDGDHANDTELDFDLVRKCGRVMFQECMPMQPPVWELVHSLPRHEITFGGTGLALWEGPERDS